MSHRAGVSAAAPIRCKDFQESDLILYVAYFLKGPLGPPSSCPWLAVSRDVCATSLNVAAERHRVSRSVHNRGRPAEAACPGKHKTNHARSPRDPDRPSRHPAKKTVQTQISSRHGIPRRETFNSLSEGREMEWTP